MEYTTNLNLKKPDVNEYYDIEKNNENMDLIDTAVGELNSQVGTETLTTTAQNCTGAINELNKNLIPTTLFDDGRTTILTYGKICIINFNNAFDINIMPLSGYILPVHSLYPTVSSCLYYSGDASIGNEEGQLYVEGNKIFLRSNISEIISKNYITGQIVFFVN